MYKNSLPRDNILLETFYGYKKLIRDLGLPVIKIDACRDGHMLLWKEDKLEEFYKFCMLPRYKQKGRRVHNPKDNRVAHAILRNLLLISRLQKLYASKVTVPHMTWHATHETNEGVKCYPFDAETWNNFNKTHTNFASEPRNIHIDLYVDGFFLVTMGMLIHIG